MTSGPEFLPEPETELVREGGRIITAIVRVQRRPAKHTVRPNPDAPVFVALDADDYPVAYIFHAPIDGVAVMDVVAHLHSDEDGPAGVERRVRHRFFTRAQIRAAVLALRDMLAATQREQAGAGA